ncbi:AAA family ATPase [Neolewinella sp.]|uniref:ATP-binding protein n=1 Tax=Neolewinella sp. TaxID=2993543 RepID=UPI003B51B164
MKYPIGIQDFRTLREGGYAYVDKTEHIHRLLTTGKYYFFSRPRRFGKSLTVATMNELYSGSEELFGGLWVQDHWDFAAMRRPVVWLKFSSSGFRTQGLEAALHNLLNDAAEFHGIELPETSFDRKFQILLKTLSVKGRVVLLIDEYDKPIIDYLDDLPRAEANRELLKSFYSVIKDSDPYLELVFITGVSAFSKVSIFSDLNNIRNISLDAAVNSLVGITETELDTHFAEPLQEVNRGVLRKWYNGYSWSGEETVYNPFSLLTFLSTKRYANYWFETGTPTFLIKALREQGRYDIRKAIGIPTSLVSFDIEHLDPITVLFQAGYLTVTKVLQGGMAYTLDYPNLEVRQSLQRHILRSYQTVTFEDPSVRIFALHHALEQRDLSAAIDIINATLASVPYDLWQRSDEHIFHALIHLTFSLLGAQIKSEVHTARGRCDALVETDDYVYIFEFKIASTAAAALAQITERGYLLPYADDPREQVAVGVNFSTATRQVDDWASLPPSVSSPP